MRHAAVASSFALLAAAGLLAGCPDRSISEVDPLQGRVEFKDIPVNVNRDIDLLFLIDDSPSMADKQTNLANNFPKFIDVLSTIPGGLPNVQIGVVTSDLGTRSANTGTPGPSVGGTARGSCSGLGKDGALQLTGVMTNGQPFLADTQPADPLAMRVRNYSGSLTTAFAQMAQVGSSGCGFEQHLEAIRVALQPSNTANAGFLRPDAYLAVIIIADEDDCSLADSALLTGDTSILGPQISFRCTQQGVLCNQGGSTIAAMAQVGTKTQCHPNDDSAYLTKVSEYAKFLKGLKSDPSKVIVAGIVGNPDPFATELRTVQGSSSTTKVPQLAHSCSYVGGDGMTEVADPAIRIKFFLDQFPNRNTFATICQQDLRGGLQQIAELLKTVLGDPCIEGQLADVDPKTPGAQYDCAVSAVVNPGQTTQVENVMPNCSTTTADPTKPCWHLDTDTVKCTAGSHQLLKIENQDALDKDTHIIANCVTEVTN
jgi:hypothetical protein